MRSLLALGIAMMLGMMPLNAQQIGVKVLGDYSLLYGNSEEFDGEKIENSALRPGFGAGIFSEFNPEGLIGVRLELLYEFRQSYNEADFNGSIAGISYELANSTSNDFQMINLPVLVCLNLGNISLYAGPNITYTLSAKGDLERSLSVVGSDGEVITDIEANVQDIDYFGDNTDQGFPDYSEESAINPFNIGANVGVIFDVTNSLQLDLRVYHGLTDVTNDEYDQSVITEESRSDNDTWAGLQLSLGYAF